MSETPTITNTATVASVEEVSKAKQQQLEDRNKYINYFFNIYNITNEHEKHKILAVNEINHYINNNDANTLHIFFNIYNNFIVKKDVSIDYAINAALDEIENEKKDAEQWNAIKAFFNRITKPTIGSIYKALNTTRKGGRRKSKNIKRKVHKTKRAH